LTTPTHQVGTKKGFEKEGVLGRATDGSEVEVRRGGKGGGAGGEHSRFGKFWQGKEKVER